jgi:2,4-dienoyl-CoA reductase-like NADH-dependent reductase (Old Yellow Enzyme family)
MSEHIVSTGHFQWRNKNRMELLNSVQKALHEQIVQTRPLWVRLSEKELATKLAKLAGLEEQRVYKAITAKSVDKELDFATTIEVFSTIRKKL